MGNRPGLGAGGRWMAAGGVAWMVVAACGQPEIQVASGFVVERVAGAEVRFPMFGAVDDRGRLYVTESSGNDLYAELKGQVRGCRVRRLEDRDGDGYFETTGIFADGLVPSMGLAWRAGRLYVADPPDLAWLEDTDGDGRADRRGVVLTGFGHLDNGSLHGLRFGPDGWLYMTTGSPDGYRLRRADGTWLEGRSGALLRCRPDGSAVEVVARGFENLVEVVFLSSGEMIGTDNWFQRPAAGIRDALVHLLEGGLYPYGPDVGTHLPRTGDVLPALSLYPAVALSGLERYTGDAYPGQWRDSLFSAQHNARKVVSHRLERIGATFRSVDVDFVWTTDPDFHPSDVLEAGDGSLLVIDTGSWYVHHCPTGSIRDNRAPGGVYRVRVGASEGAGRTSGGLEQEMRLASWRAASRRGDAAVVPELLEGLRSGPLHVQLAAAEALAFCGTADVVGALVERLAALVPDPHLEHAVVHALWRLARPAQLEAALDHPSLRVQRAALELLDQPPFARLGAGAVEARLFAEDAALRRTALRSLAAHPEWSPMVERVLGRLSSEAGPGGGVGVVALGELVVRFAGEPPVASQLAVLVGGSAADAVQQAVVEALARVEPERVGEVWRAALGRALDSTVAELRGAAVRTIRSLRLAGFEQPLERIARDAAVDARVRMQALRALRSEWRLRDAAMFAWVLSELEPLREADRRLVAADLLASARLTSEQFAAYLRAVAEERLIAAATVMEAMPEAVDRRAAEALVSWLERPPERVLGLPEARRRAVLAALPEAARARVRRLFDATAIEDADAVQRLRASERWLTGGDADRGRAVFEGKAGCAACHRVGAAGGLLGPDLTRIGAIRSGRDLIESLLYPSATFAQGYEPYRVTLGTGEQWVGVRVAQPDDSVVLRDAAGVEVRFAAGAAALTLERSALSLMPEGLLEGLSEVERRDLFAYLAGLR